MFSVRAQSQADVDRFDDCEFPSFQALQHIEADTGLLVDLFERLLLVCTRLA